MNTECVKRQTDITPEFRCVVCGQVLTSGELCKLCERRGLSPEQYAEFFWEEA
jgi:hypothetical protein